MEIWSSIGAARTVRVAFDQPHSFLMGMNRGPTMGNNVCPRWLGYFLASPLRRLPRADPLLENYVRSGMTVLELGPGMGYFTAPLERRVGGEGRIIDVDIQPQMIAGLRRRHSRESVTRQGDPGGEPCRHAGTCEHAHWPM
jgi:hypothetical protein